MIISSRYINIVSAINLGGGMYHQDSSENKAQIKKVVLDMVDWINENLLNPINVQDVTVRSGYSSRYFQTCFQLVMGVTIGRHIRYKKMDLAASLIVLPDATVTKVQLMLGYESSTTFCRLFRSEHGVSPLKFRLNHLK